MDADTFPCLVDRYPLLITKLCIPLLDTKLLTWRSRMAGTLLRPIALQQRGSLGFAVMNRQFWRQCNCWRNDHGKS
jgi:hypothetical protein